MAAPAKLLQSLLNRGLDESATARAQARELDGRSLAIELTPPGLRLRLSVRDGRCEVKQDDAPADAELSGSPLSFARVLDGDGSAAFRAGGLKLAGDPDTAMRFQALLRMAAPEAEELLSRVFGDVAGHELYLAGGEAAAWARRALRSLGRSLAEYLRDERGETPSRTELEEFHAAVDELQHDVERAAQRLARLGAREQA
ncbi:MAG: hypothetical protein D6727_05555 [Gammaproteobacteria bacterium]|nr:MAG: hypothetical protein D6727_05555 [Gammaproteobacteria bacterium]